MSFEKYSKLRCIKVCDAKQNKEFFKSLILSNINRYDLIVEQNSKAKEIYFMDGAIGSGKSTILRNVIQHLNLYDLLYYNPEYHMHAIGWRGDFITNYNSTSRFLWQNIANRLKSGESFVVESVFTKSSKVAFLNEAKNEGYRLVGIYAGTSDVKINIDRVLIRTKNGGHYVPTDKIKDRYDKSLNNFRVIYELVDDFLVFDNSSDFPELLMYKSPNSIQSFVDKIPLWLKLNMPN